MSRWVLAAVIIGAVALVTYLIVEPRAEISRAEAQAKALESLAEYSEREGIQLSRFGEPEVMYDSARGWIFEYESAGRPRHAVVVLVGKSGAVQVSRYIEEGR